jgi:hypothetical protein
VEMSTFFGSGEFWFIWLIVLAVNVVIWGG